MKKLKFLICILCWLTISPLFYYLSGKWGVKQGRLFLMLVSPLFLVLYLVAFIWGLYTYGDIKRKYYFTDEDRIERITGVRLPDMSIVEYHKGRTAITGDYSDKLIVEFEEDISERVYQILDSLIATKNTSWRKDGDIYVFSAFWGNHIPAPKGENDEEDRFFDLAFEKGSIRATINNGVW